MCFKISAYFQFSLYILNYYVLLLIRSNEKRKLATKEIEKIVKFNADKDDFGQIMKIIEYFRDKFIFSNQSPYKKGGLLAFSAISVAISSNVKGSNYQINIKTLFYNFFYF